MSPTQSQIIFMYFQNFCKKDVASLEVLFSDSIVLTDWNVQVVGKQNLLDFNQRFFNSVGNIRIDVDKIAIAQDTVIAEIRVIIADTEISVVDVIDFDQDNKIKEIRAYKR